MDIHEATRSYEQWLSAHTSLLAADLRLKHTSMADDLLAFLRATFYRWAQNFPEVCPACAKAPRILAVGDLHLENFGTWQDAEGRLAWGINDFDEAFPLPYTIDLVRCATSVLVALRLDHLQLKPKAACFSILDGYHEALRDGGHPFIVDDQHRWMVPVLGSPERDPASYWPRLRQCPPVTGPIPSEVRIALARVLPNNICPPRLQHRIAGLGSLGKQRYLALVQYQGGWIAREAKPLTPSACVWLRPQPGAPAIYYDDIMRRAVRCQDPFFRVENPWLVRRKSPACSRIELDSLTQVRDEEELLYSMGYETGNIHLGNGTTARRRIREDLSRRPTNWLRKASESMLDATVSDWKDWRRSQRR